LPAGGYVPPSLDLWSNLKSMIMPAFVLGTGTAAIIMRHTRSAMVAAMKQDYVRTARAKGVKERIIVRRHALPNALIPVVTLGTLQFGELLAGAVLTEQVFSIPGFGKMIVDGVFSRDYAVVQAVVLCTAAFFLMMSLVADIAYTILNPRLRT
jgi:peptide/nickel transport system permease protein